jgi:1-deoxy-D-xylulose-5-phosphate reductoisomerase
VRDLGLQKVAVLGATGSIGSSTLDVLGRHPLHFEVTLLAANRSVESMHQLCRQFRPAFAYLADAESNAQLAQVLAGTETRVLAGEKELCECIASADVDTVMAAIVGAAGLQSTLAAARAGKKILLANKESLVMAGALLMKAVAQSGSTLLPIDSEHNAIFQCLESNERAVPAKGGVESIILTATGGPFPTWSARDIVCATPAQAIAHPNWSMGPKISVDSASLMNKGLELIEASWLFNMPVDKIEVVVHPQSIIHSMVRFVDGSVLAQMGNPDMRTPIAYGLAWPKRIESGVKPLDLSTVGELTFEKADLNRFPCLRLAIESAAQGGTASAVCNAANEVAVQAFLDHQISFGDIPRVVELTLSEVANMEPTSLDVVLLQDTVARAVAAEHVERLKAKV